MTTAQTNDHIARLSDLWIESKSIRITVCWDLNRFISVFCEMDQAGTTSGE